MHDQVKPTGFDADAAHRPSALGVTVRGRRQALGLSQHEVAVLAGCGDRFVHTLEQGKATVRLDKVIDVLEVLGLGLRVGAGVPGVTEAHGH